MRYRVGKFLLVWLCLLVSFGCHAESDALQQSDNVLTLGGYGTLGFARSNIDSAEYIRDLTQPRGLTTKWSSSIDSLLGVQATLKIDQQTNGVLQVVSRYGFDRSYNPEILWAFLRHEFSPDYEVRAGRLGTEVYMLSDSSLVGYSNMTVRPAPDYYGLLVFSNFDGIDTTFTHALGNGLLRAKLYAGYSPATLPTVSAPWNLKGTSLVGGYLDYFQGGWQFRASHAEVRWGSDLPLNDTNDLIGFDIRSIQPELSTKGKPATYDSFGVAYDKGPLQIQVMLNRIKHQSQIYENSHAEMALASYRFQQLTPYVGYSQIKSHAKSFTSVGDPLIDSIVSSIGSFTHTDQHTVTLGARWDFRQNLALKVELDAIRGKPESIFLFSEGKSTQSQWNGRMNVISVALDFVF